MKKRFKEYFVALSPYNDDDIIMYYLTPLHVIMFWTTSGTEPHEWIDLNNQLFSVGLQVIHRLDNSTDSKYFYLEILECESLRPIRLIEDNRFYSMSELITFLMQ